VSIRNQSVRRAYVIIWHAIKFGIAYDLIGLEDKKFLPLCGTTGMSCGFWLGFLFGRSYVPFGTISNLVRAGL
jgi:hypothetical protein